MKKFWYIIPVILMAGRACSSLRFTGTVNDDLYYRPSDQPVIITERTAEARSTDQTYYDNIFAADTLIADEYIPDSEYAEYAAGSEAAIVNNYYGSSAAERIYLFNDDYFYPYWRDPFYFSPFSMRLNFGYSYWGYPYYRSYDPFWYDWYSPYSYYSPYYSYYGGYYPYYSPFSYYGYNPWYSSYMYPSLYYADSYKLTTGRRGGYSS